MQDLIKSAIIEGNKWSLSQLISIFEDKRFESIKKRKTIIELLEQTKKSSQNYNKKSASFGITGSPGVGKSSLINKIIFNIISNNLNIKIAVIAVDPSSPNSGGSFLGDRERILFDENIKFRNQIFFRSQAAENNLGGISAGTYIVTRLLKYFFDIIFIETVGIGQSETEIKHLSDKVILVMQPNSGDQIQFLKAGVMEIPDLFIINKCDDIVACRKSLLQLRTALNISNLSNSVSKIPIEISSTYSGLGVDKITKWIEENRFRNQKNNFDIECFYLEKWIKFEFGMQGFAKIQKINGELNISNLLNKLQTFENVQEYCFEKLL